jgi:hypothetical protein
MLYTPRKLITGPRGQKLDGQKEGFGEWQVVEASDVKVRGRFRACVDKWEGTTVEKNKYFGIKKEDFLRMEVIGQFNLGCVCHLFRNVIYTYKNT